MYKNQIRKFMAILLAVVMLFGNVADLAVVFAQDTAGETVTEQTTPTEPTTPQEPTTPTEPTLPSEQTPPAQSEPTAPVQEPTEDPEGVVDPAGDENEPLPDQSGQAEGSSDDIEVGEAESSEAGSDDLDTVVVNGTVETKVDELTGETVIYTVQAEGVSDPQEGMGENKVTVTFTYRAESLFANSIAALPLSFYYDETLEENKFLADIPVIAGYEAYVEEEYADYLIDVISEDGLTVIGKAVAGEITKADIVIPVLYRPVAGVSYTVYHNVMNDETGEWVTAAVESKAGWTESQTNAFGIASVTDLGYEVVDVTNAPIMGDGTTVAYVYYQSVSSLLTGVELSPRTIAATVGNTTVQISGNLPEGAVVHAAEVSYTPQDLYNMGLISAQEIATANVAVALDIAILYNGVKFQPKNFGQSVIMSISDAASGNFTEADVYHIENNSAQQLTASTTESAAVFATDSFSVYLVVTNTTANPDTNVVEKVEIAIGNTKTFTVTRSYYNSSFELITDNLDENVASVTLTGYGNTRTVSVTANGIGESSFQIRIGSTTTTYNIKITEEIIVEIIPDILDNGRLVAEISEDDAENYTYQWYESTNGTTFNPIEDATGVDLPIFDRVGDSAADAGSRYSYKVEMTNKQTGEVITSGAYQIPYYSALQNGSFETPVVTSTTGWAQYPNGTGGWTTTGLGSGNMVNRDIEIVRPSLDTGSTTMQYYHTNTVLDGAQFAELNCETWGALYQDVMTIPGSTIYWGLAHSGREGLDKMQVRISDVRDIPAGWNPAQQELSDVQGTFTDDRDDWNYYGPYTYTVPEGQYVTRFYFVSVTAGGVLGGPTYGNLLDCITFSRTRPTPPPVTDSPKLNEEITVTKLWTGDPAPEGGYPDVKVVLTSEEGTTPYWDEIGNNEYTTWTVPTGHTYDVSEEGYTPADKTVSAVGIAISNTRSKSCNEYSIALEGSNFAVAFKGNKYLVWTVKALADDAAKQAFLDAFLATNPEAAFASINLQSCSFIYGYPSNAHTGTDGTTDVKNDGKIHFTAKNTWSQVAFGTYKLTQSYTFTNTFKDYTAVSGTKTWNDDDDRDGLRPESVTVRLYANDVLVEGKTALVSEDTEWKYSFENLDKYDSEHKLITYTVKEDAVAGYDTTYNGNNITNTHTPEAVSLTVRKDWNDGNNSDGLRPASIQVELYIGETPVANVEPLVLNADNNWKGTFENLPKNAEGTQITYTVKETTVLPAGYTSAAAYKEDITGEYVIVNSYAPETVDISGTKTWEDDNNRDGIRPKSIVVKLMVGSELKDTVTVSPDANGDWKYSFTGLPKKAAGVDIVYTVEEEAVTGYTPTVTGYDIKNTHTPEKTEVSVEKIWNDGENRDGKRASYTLQLLANGANLGEAVTLDADETTWTFVDLYKYAEGKEITYTVAETKIGDNAVVNNATADYKVTYGKKTDGVLTVTNTHTTEKTSVSGIKTWTDGDNRDNIRPESITVNLLADGVEIDEVIVVADNGWAYSFENLDKYQNGGKLIDYTITEDEVNGYTPAVNGYNLTNTHTPEALTVSGEKTWNDGNNRDGSRPVSITVNLYAGNDKVASKTVTDRDGWKWEFKTADNGENLYKYADGAEIVYTVTEEKVEGYTTQVNDFDITNNYTPKTVNITVGKIWADGENRDGYRGAIELTLYRNGVADAPVTVAYSANMTYEWKDLPAYEKGEPISYDVAETKVNGSAVVNTLTADGRYSVEHRSDSTVTGSVTTIAYTITNTHTPETVDITVNKNWEDDDNRDGYRGAIEVTLSGSDGYTDTQTIAYSDKMTYTWENRPYRANGDVIEYTLTENKVNGSAVNTSENITADGRYEVLIEKLADENNNIAFTVTNTHTPEVVDITATKQWADNNNQDGRRASYTLQLLADGTPFGQAVTKAADELTHTWENLNKYAAGKEIVYTVEETKIGAENVVDNKTTYYDVTYGEDGLTVTNTHTPEVVDITATKQWEDNNNQDGRRASYTLQLLADGTPVGQAVTKAADELTHTWEDLNKYAAGKEIVYTVEETKIGDENVVDNKTTYYDVTYGEDGLTVTNTHTPEVVDITATKQWADNNNQDGRRASYTLQLLADGSAIGEAVTNEAGVLSYTWKGLSKYAAGKEIVYTVKETKIGDENVVDNKTTYYDVTYGENGLTVTNTHTPEVVDITTTKQWADNNNQDGRRASYTLQLLANGTPFGQAVTKAADELTHTWEDLNKYAAGKEIVYTVQETKIGAENVVDNKTTYYDVTYGEDGLTVTNTHTPEVVDITATKQWADNNNQDGRRASYTLQLLANGEPFGQAVTKAADELTHTWEDLNKYAAGKEIVYTVEETKIGDENVVDNKTTYYDVTYGEDGLTVINTHTPEVVDITAVKKWEDNENQDGRRASFTLQLMADGVAVEGEAKIVNISAAGYTWKDLPKYANGKEVTYTVEETKIGNEDVVDNKTTYYVVTYGEDGLTVTNTHTPETKEITVTKQWEDDDNRDGLRPETVTVDLYVNNTLLEGKEITISADDDWKGKWEDLPVYENGEEIEYTLAERTVVGYTMGEPVEKTEDNFTITNSYTPGKVSIPVTKKWADDGDRDGLRPDEIVVVLYKTVGTSTTEAARETITGEGDSWTHTFADMPQKEAGQAITYTVDEQTVDGEDIQGYVKSINGYTITNTHTPKTIDITANKVWEDDNDRDGYRGDIVFTLTSSDGVNHPAVTVKEAAEMSYTWEDLPYYFNGEKIEYTVTETKVDASQVVSGATANGRYKVGYDIATDTLTDDITVTVTNTHAVETVKINGEKHWDDENDAAGFRPESITVILTADSVKVAQKTVVPNDDGIWAYEFEATDGETPKPLYKYADGEIIVYDVEEMPVAEYEVSYSPTDYDITNTHTPETVEVTFKKAWEDNNNQDGLRPQSITVNLLADKTVIATKTITAADGWQWVFTAADAEPGATPQPLYKYAGGKQVVYTIVETHLEGEEVKENKVGDYTVSYGTPVVNEVSGDTQITVTNSHTPETTERTVKKLWKNAPAELLENTEVYITLYADSAEKETATLTKDNNGEWKHTFTDLPKYRDGGIEIDYRIEERAINGFELTSNAFAGDTVTLTNSNVEKVKVSGFKTWEDDDDRDGIRPQAITVNLLADDVEVKEITVTPDKYGVWAYSFENLAKYKDGKLIVYTVTEDAIEGYTEQITPTEKGFDIKNTHEIETVEISGNKVWEDDNNRDRLRPESVTVTLYADGEATDKSAVVNAASEWKYSFKNLPKNENGEAISYTVKETKIGEETVVDNKAGGYTASYSNNGLTITNTHTVDTVEISGNKVWEDDNNRDRLRPESVTVTLYADGEATDKSAVVNAASEWKYSFKNLPKNENGEAITYTVKETKIGEETVVDNKAGGYTASYSNNGLTITNTHTVETVDVTFNKIWADNGNQDGKRAAYTVELQVEGVTVAASEITLAADKTTHTWKGLPKYEDGKEIEYKVVETKIGEETVTDNKTAYYTVSYAEDNNGNTVITNKHDVESTDISVEKIWADDNDRDGLRPNTLQVTLYSQMTVNGSRTVAGTWTFGEGNNGWAKHTFKEMPVYSAGYKLIYTIVEENVPGYTPEIAGNATEGFTVTNTHIPATVNINLTKKWEDEDNVNSTRAESVKVTLSAGEASVASPKGTVETEAILNGGNSWKKIWSELYKFEGGKEITYTIAEDTLAGYDAKVDIQKAADGKNYNYTLTNTLKTLWVKYYTDTDGTGYALYNEKTDYRYKDKVTILPDAPEIVGKTFSGWYLDEGLLKKAENFEITKNTNIYGKYTDGPFVGYTVVHEYYTDETIEDELTQYDSSNAADKFTWGTEIAKVDHVDREGFEFSIEKSDKLPLILTKVTEDNVITLRYYRQKYNYKVVYNYVNLEGVEFHIADITGTEFFGKSIEVDIDLHKKAEYTGTTEYDKSAIEITTDEDKNIAVVTYHVVSREEVQVRNYFDGQHDETKDQLIDAAAGETLDLGKDITSYADDIYEFDVEKTTELPYKVVDTTAGGENVIDIYYVSRSYAYSVEYYYNGVRSDAATETQTAKISSVVTETMIPDKRITGFILNADRPYDNAPLTITSDIAANVIRVYYVTLTTPEPTPRVPTLPDPTIIPTPPTPPTPVIPDEPTPLAGGSSWALYNLILTILTSLLSIALLEGYFKDQKEEEEESDEQIMALAMKEEEPEEKKIDRKLVTRILSIVFSIGALILFFLTEDMTNPMSLTDKWTVWHVIIALIQCVDALLSKKSKDEEEKADEGSLERA